ncbi:ATP-dependent helicase HrpB [Desulfuromonas versatilis]|uniref:ATP-dependent helicase HrpB n=1 Tax=Desulfuromonas versatilis TaxID=2802975 RepID=A0ABN6E0J3_9BACT|nr:ATP-dependent helicase HrpB [Desulfuromonas versatilis]BCR05852.1 ATP-dependent helicase HrpB [Desulfuromonas versatilis]
MTSNLPIDPILPELKQALAGRDAAVLQAPPGAGKTTRVPLALLDEPWLAGRSILMLEPRRLAATNAARFMASLLGEEAGRTVGYAIRYERRVSRVTRIEVVTEGILTRRLQTDPTLEGVGLVIFDEFHERNLNSDLALALCRDAQLGLREDLKILVMSATLDAEPVAHLLGGAPLLTSQGRSFPVQVRYLEQDPVGKPAEYTAAAIRRALREAEGDLLAFLPGAGEIRRCAELLADPPAAEGPLICPLYAELPFAEQERAILPAGRRKVVLATNIAETSLTIEGVCVVVDSGLARQPRFDPAAGLSRLETLRISRASAEQRAGRAGRLAPGVCYRLWSEGTHGSLLPFTPPEIRSADLAPLALDLARWGVADPMSLAWLDPPPAGALAGARQLLETLGALDPIGRITPRGEAMGALPAHPRIARLLAAAREWDDLPLGCELAALLGERDLFRRGEGPSRKSDSDLLDRLEALAAGRRQGGRGGAAAVERAVRYWRQVTGCGPGAPAADAERVGRLLAVAFPERIGRERQPGSGRYLLSGGQGARLSPRSNVHAQPFIVAVEVRGGKGEGEIEQASALSLGSIEELFPEVRGWTRAVSWDEREGRVAAREERRLGALVLASRQVGARPEETLPALLEGIRSRGLEALNWSGEARRLAARVRFVARVFPDDGWPDLSPERLAASLEEWLGPFLGGVKSLGELARLDLVEPLRALLDWARQRRLDQLAPSHLEVPSGSRVPLDYPAEGHPVLAVKLQEMFGLADTPRLAEGRVAVLLHLLSPARRPIQVTQDLRNFWENVYPEVKKELKGRYPKHPWPDDPWNAEPTRFAKRRG